ncbi:MAG TPA: hypothetical protein VGE74_31925 [Gemmata sp.]
MTAPTASGSAHAHAEPTDLPHPKLAECDLVMKGGITSGVVYPAAVVELSKKFRFWRIGGASAGAIAAAGAAAAEFGRYAPDPDPAHPDAPKPGFKGLEQLRRELTQDGMLIGLFKPGPERWARTLFGLFRDLLDGVPASVRLAHFVGGPGLIAVAVVAFGALLFSGGEERNSELPFQLGWGAAGAAGAFFVALFVWNHVLRGKARPRNPDGSHRRGFVCWLFERSGVWAAAVYACVGFALGVFVASLVAETHTHKRPWWHLAAAGETLATGFIEVLIGVPTAAVWYYWQSHRWSRKLKECRYGISHGLAPRGPDGKRRRGEPDRLTDYLHQKLNQLAGLHPDEVLTFGHLMGPSKHAPKGIRLRLMTSNLSLQRPYVFPLPKGTHFLFRKSQFAELFPPEVVAHLTNPGHQPRDVPPIDPAANDLFYLPDGEHLPVVVAVRMSLAHPGLFSAVPLYAITQKYIAEKYWPAVQENARREHAAERAEARTRSGTGAPPESAPPVPVPGLTAAPADVRETWFSDGGIVSNFPIHIFDEWFPDAPTFGINLADALAPDPDCGARVDPSFLVCPWAVDENAKSPSASPVHLPTADEALVAEWSPIQGLAQMFSAVFYAAKNHRTNAQTELPGFRERIATIRLTDTEGGLNLNMPPHVVAKLVGYGEQAGEVLAERLLPGGPASQFGHHQWVRLRLALAHLERELRAIQSTCATAHVKKRVEQLLAAAGRKGALPGYPFPLDPPSERPLEVFRALLAWCDQHLAQGRVFDVDPPVLVPDPVKRFVPAEGDDR